MNILGPIIVHNIDTILYERDYYLIQNEINNGRPLVLGTRSINSYGHYVVVTGYEGMDYLDAKIYINDPYGLWIGFDTWCSDCSGNQVKQDFTTFTNKMSDGVFVIRL